jgi:hypothetical protein
VADAVAGRIVHGIWQTAMVLAPVAGAIRYQTETEPALFSTSALFVIPTPPYVMDVVYWKPDFVSDADQKEPVATGTSDQVSAGPAVSCASPAFTASKATYIYFTCRSSVTRRQHPPAYLVRVGHAVGLRGDGGLRHRSLDTLGDRPRPIERIGGNPDSLDDHGVNPA